jgi:hypothetical protein
MHAYIHRSGRHAFLVGPEQGHLPTCVSDFLGPLPSYFAPAGPLSVASTITLLSLLRLIRPTVLAASTWRADTYGNRPSATPYAAIICVGLGPINKVRCRVQSPAHALNKPKTEEMYASCEVLE